MGNVSKATKAAKAAGGLTPGIIKCAACGRRFARPNPRGRVPKLCGDCGRR